MAKSMRIAALSVPAAELEQIKSMMATLRGDTGANWEWISDGNAADVLIIDVDSLYGHMDWLKAQSSGRNVICLTAASGHEQDNVLHRPISVGGLRSCLLRAAGGAMANQAAVKHPTQGKPSGPAATRPSEAAKHPSMQASPTAASVPKPAATATPATPRGPGKIQAPSLLPKRTTGQPPAIPDAMPPTAASDKSASSAAIDRPKTLADYLLPENLGEVRKLERDGHPPLIVDAAADRYYGGLTLKPLLAYCLGTIRADEWKPVPAAEIAKLREINAGLPLSRLLWLYVIGTSNGTSLLPGLDQNAKFKLIKWPQIEREFPKHFRIGTAMMKGFGTLAEIADASGATIGEVIDFVNAYAAIGFAVQEGGQPITDRRALIESLRSRAI